MRALDQQSSKTVLSGSEGRYLIADLQPGAYYLMARAGGLVISRPDIVQIAQNQVTYADIQLRGAGGNLAPNWLP